MRRYVIALSMLATAAGTPTSALAGSLNPPPGPVTSTMKTLSDVEPRTALSQANTPGNVTNQFKITQPGSYYLAGDIIASPGANPCILITANDVTLDLNGFSVRAAAAEGIHIAGDRVLIRNGKLSMSAGSADGIYMQDGADDIVIEDMTITGVGGSCVRTQSACNSVTIRDTKVMGGQYGVLLTSADTSSTLSHVQCFGASRVGLFLSDRATLEDCVVRETGNAGGIVGYGIYVGQASSIRNCQVLDSLYVGAAAPATGISASGNSTIDGCTVYSRGSVGVRLSGQGTTLRNSRVTMGAAGQTAVALSNGDSFIADNQITAPTGIAVQLNSATGNTVIRNHLANATTAIAGSAVSSNIIGPTASNGNPTANTNPHANFVN